MTTAEQCCPRYPNCTHEFYEPHWCENGASWGDDGRTQARLDDCRTLTELTATWRKLERRGEVDLIYGAEWHHAVAHLRYQQAGHETGEPS